MKQLLLITTFLALMAGAAIAQPVVSVSTPSRNATNVALDANINIVFNETMDESTLNANSILVYGSYRGKYSGTFSFSGATNTTAIFNPDVDFLLGEVITVVVTNDAESSGNVAMARSYSFSFTATADGDGLFQPEVSFSAVPGSQADDVVAADFNGDGNMDLAVLSQGNSTISVHFSNGDGTFATPVVLNTTSIAMELEAADVNGNGYPDLLVSNISAFSLSVFTNNGDNTFGSRQDYGTSASLPAASMVVMDITGDGSLDVVQLHRAGTDTTKFLFHYTNDGNGAFGTGEQVSIADLPSGGSLALSYHNATTIVSNSLYQWRPHLLVTDYSNNQLRVYENDGSGTSYAFAQTRFAGTNPVAVGGYRLYTNSPGADAVVLNSGSDNITVYRAPEVWSAESFGSQTNFSVGDSPYALSGGDLDGDGAIDLLVANNVGGTLSYLPNSSGTFYTNNELDISGNPNAVALADLDNDGKLDIISANTNGTVSILYNYPGPEISSVTPANNATDVDSYDDIVIEFSVDFMDGSTMNASTIQVLDNNSDVIPSTFNFSGSTLTITPDAPFQQGTSVSVTVTAGVESTTGLAIINPTTFSFDVAESVLEITSLSPSAYELQHPVASGVSISFSESVVLSTLSTGVSVVGSIGGNYAGTWSGTSTVTFSPSATFLPGETITVTVFPTVSSLSGAQLETAYEYTFTANSNPLGSLLAPQEFSTAVGIEKALVADMTNDGNPDVVIYGEDYMTESNYIKVLSSDGLGGLVSTETTTFTPYRLQNVLLDDFNNDGNIDAAILDSHVSSGGGGGEEEFGEITGTTGASGETRVTIILGIGDGTFNTTSVQTSLPADYEIENFVSGDLNGDGNADLIFTREEGNDAIVLLGQGNGSFSVQTPVSVPNGPYGLTLADINLDGNLDLLTGTMNNSGLAILEGNGDGTFASPATISLNVDAYEIIVQDFDNDGYPDLVVGGDNPVEVLLNDGFGGFTSAQTFTASWAMEAIDLDGNAYPDLLFNNSSGLLVYTNNGDGTFNTSPKVFPGGSVSYMGIVDMNGDGSADVVAGGSSSVSIYESVTPVLLTSFTPTSNSLDVGVSTPVTVTFDSDMNAATLDASSIQVTSSVRGKLAGSYTYDAGTRTVTFDPTTDFIAGEVISVNVTKDAESSGGVPIESGKFFSFTTEADGYGFFEPEIGMSLTGSLLKTLGADMTGNGITDLITASYSDGVKVYQNDGTGGLTEISTLSISNLNNVWVHDLNQDGFPDVIAKRDSDNNIYFFINNGTGGFVETDYNSVDNFYIGINMGTAAVAFADINGDGIEDLTFASPNFSNARFVLGEGNLAYGNNTFVGSDGGYALEVADVNNDGIPDLVWAGNGDGAGTVHIAVGQGGGSFGSVTTRDVGERPEALVVADLTGNGYPDIATADVNGQSYSVIINSGGSFGQAAIYNTSGFEPEAIFSSDVDGDGDLDLLVSGALETYIAEYDYTTELPKVLVAYNDGNGGFGNQIYFSNDYEDPNYYEGPQNISVLDLDGDGRLDIAGYARGMDESFNTLHNFAFLNNSVAGSSSAPTTAASNPSSSDISSSSAMVSWTNGDGLRRLVIVKEGSAVDATLTDDAGYNANPAFGSGTEIGTGNFVVYGGTGNSVTISGLNSETEYHYAIYETNGIPGQEKVVTSGAPTGSFTTAVPPEIWKIADGSVTFTKDDYADWTLEENQDRIAYNIWLTKQDKNTLFNQYSESEVDDDISPKGTLWAYGTADDIESLTFDSFKNTVYEQAEDLPGESMVMYMTEHNVYVEVEFTSWTSGQNGGGFSYTRAAGTVAPPPPPTFDAEAGFALQFDGVDDYIYYDLEDPETEEDAPMPDPVTFEMWVKPDTFTDDKMVIGSSYGNQYRFGIDSTRAFYATFREGAVGAWKRATGTTVVNEDQWYHLAISANSGGEIKVYVNGVLEGSTSTSEVNTSISRYHFGGLRYSGTGEYHRFNGLMDEVRIWKTERTKSEIRSTMFTTASGGGYSNMFATWQMNEGTGNSVVDLVNGNNLDLTLGGASTQPAWVTSDVPIGGEAPAVANSVQTETTTIGNATLSLADGFDNPVDVQVTEVTANPNVFPTGFTSGVGGKYFVINLFGDPGTFSVNLTLNYGSGTLTSSNPAEYKLFKRGSNSTGAWTEVASAATSVDIGTGAVTWSGITAFSQFMAVLDEIEFDIQITDGADVVSYNDSTFEFAASFFDLTGSFEDSTLTINSKSTLTGDLFIDQNDNGSYDDGTDNLLIAGSEFSYTPSGSTKLRYKSASSGVETAVIKLQLGEAADSVSLDFFTVEGDPELAGNSGENGWYLLSNPFTTTIGELLSNIWTQGAVNSDAPSADATLYRFVQDSAQYLSITTDLDTTKLAAGEGLLAYIFEDDDILDGEDDIDGGWPKTLSNYGNPFGTDVSIPVKNVDHDGVSGTTGSEGFVLLGNPYGWPLSADSVISKLKGVDELANSYVYRWNPTAKVYQLLSTGSIEPYESVFVRVVNSGTSGSLSFEYDDAVLSPTKLSTPKLFELELSNEKENISSVSNLRFGKGGELAIDPYDGYYLGSYASKYANLYTLVGDQPLTINNVPVDESFEKEFPIYLDATVSGTFKLSWPKDLIPEGMDASLVHVETGKTFDLNAGGSFEFTVGKNKLSPASAAINPIASTEVVMRAKQNKLQPMFMLVMNSRLGTSNEFDLGIPTEVELYQNYPNPFNPTSVIRYGVPEASKVKLEVFDILGRNVMTLINNETISPGRYNVQFDARSLASGMYIYRLVVGEKVMTKKMMLIK